MTAPTTPATLLADEKPWSTSVGEPPYRVVAYERPEKGWVVYLRWRDEQTKNWAHESLRKGIRTAQGKLKKSGVEWATNEAKRKKLELELGIEPADAPRRPLTLVEGLQLAIDPKRGLYKANTPHRREVVRSIQHAARVLGERKTWDALKMGDLSEVWTDRIRALRARGRTGHRGAEVVIRDLLAVAAWLRGEGHISATACVFDGKVWKEKLRKDWQALAGSHREPEPSRPRHDLEEMRKIIRVAWKVDPRFGLLVILGAELRLGQVLRARRSDLDLDAGTFTVYGMGHKRGTVVHLTAGQLAAVRAALETGYLAELEAERVRTGADYCLFPAGHFKGSKAKDPNGKTAKSTMRTAWNGRATVERHMHVGPICRSRIDAWFSLAEQYAEVPHVRGRGAYGIRRVAVDAANEEGISREALQQHGGWADLQVPDRIYRDQQRGKARDEARDVRARIRGEETS